MGGWVDGCSKAALYTPLEYHPLAAEISRRDLISVERGEEIEEIAWPDDAKTLLY